MAHEVVCRAQGWRTLVDRVRLRVWALGVGVGVGFGVFGPVGGAGWVCGGGGDGVDGAVVEGSGGGGCLLGLLDAGG